MSTFFAAAPGGGLPGGEMFFETAFGNRSVAKQALAASLAGQVHRCVPAIRPDAIGLLDRHGGNLSIAQRAVEIDNLSDLAITRVARDRTTDREQFFVEILIELDRQQQLPLGWERFKHAVAGAGGAEIEEA